MIDYPRPYNKIHYLEYNMLLTELTNIYLLTVSI